MIDIETFRIPTRRYLISDTEVYCIPVRWYLMIDTEVFCIPIRRYLISDAEAYCILISDTETFTHTYKLIPGCAHTNILISDKWVLSGMNVQKTDANRSVLSETISIEPYANGPVSKYPDSEYEYVDAIESA